jgi:hypothetical protein
MRFRFLAPVAAAGLIGLASCTPAGDSAIVFGESRAGTPEAVQAALNAVRAAEGSGCHAKSIGSGAYAAGGGGRGETAGGGGQMVNVVVLLDCPTGVGAKILPATGARVP